MTDTNISWQGGSIVWGNYGGRGWTGGMYDRNFFDVPTTNAPDEYFRAHDLSYYNASRDADPTERELLADAKLANQLAQFNKTAEFRDLNLVDRSFLKAAET